MGELSQKIMNLSQELQQCGSNQDCIRKVMEEMTALQQEYIKLQQGLTQQSGVPPSQPLSCDKFFRAGWSCLPVKISVSRKIEERDYASDVDPSASIPCNEQGYITREHHFRYTAEGAGILEYTKDYAEFSIWTKGEAPGVRLAQYQGFVRSCDRMEGGGYTFTTRSYPIGGVTVEGSFGFSVHYPGEAGTPTNCGYSGPTVVTSDSEYGSERDVGFNPKNVDLSFVMTPEMVKSAVAGGQFSKTFHWRILHPNGRSYDDNTLDVRLEFGKPPIEKPGAMVVSASDGFGSNGPDKSGAFTPPSKTYTVKNTGESALSYTVAKSAAWLTLDSTGGTLNPNGSATVTATIDASKAKSLPADTYKDTLKFTNATDGKGNTTRPVDLTVGEEQTWQVFLTGYEIDEMDAYWKITTKLRGAIRFDYKLRGEFTIAKKKGKWTYKSGTITIAEVGLSNLYEPLEAWLIKPIKCFNCYDVTNLKGTPLPGYVEGNEVKFNWGKHWPKTIVKARIAIPCKPMPKCAEWGDRMFASMEFFDRVNFVPCPLKHEGIVGPKKPIISPQGTRWINYTYTLRRLK
jgi:hypothetical protein